MLSGNHLIPNTKWHLRRDCDKRSNNQIRRRDYTMEKLLEDLKTQLQLLNFTKQKSDGIIEKGNVEGVERQLQSLRSIATRVEEFKLQIEQGKIAKGEKLDDVSQWSLTIEAEQTSADENVAHLRKWLTSKEKAKRKRSKEKAFQKRRDNKPS